MRNELRPVSLPSRAAIVTRASSGPVLRTSRAPAADSLSAIRRGGLRPRG